MLFSWLRRLFFGPSYKIVYGSSFATIDEAVAEAKLKVDDLASQGWEAISIGCGGRAAGGGEGGMGQAVDVVVLMRH